VILQGEEKRVKPRAARPLFQEGKNGKRPPEFRQPFPSGRIVPTEARPSELSGCIVGGGDGGVKAKSVWK